MISGLTWTVHKYGISIRWDGMKEVVVQYSPEPKFDVRLRGTAIVNGNSYEIIGLSSKRTYYVRLGEDGEWSRTFEVRTL
jgi:hypothetical protein